MALERGFRRIVIALSIVLLIFGIAFDAIIVIPHTTVRVTLVDGRQEAMAVQWVGDYPTDRKSLARELSGRPGFTVEASDIKDVTVLRGLKYVWWSDYVGTMFAAGLTMFFWIAFYVVRWIVRGFGRP